jgi:hypothetical protein
MQGKSRALFSTVMIVLLSVALLSVSGTWVFAAGGEVEISAEAWNTLKAELEVLDAEHNSLTPVQRKVNSNIIRHLHVRVLRDRPDTLPYLQHNVSLNNKNEILTDIKANVSDAVLKMITDNGGTIINKFPEYRAIRALIPITAVETIAAHPDIQFINLAAQASTSKAISSDRAAPASPLKKTTSEGDVAHRANLVRAIGWTGKDVKVGVIADSVDNLAYVQQFGDLPYVEKVNQMLSGSGKGTAMLEIIYDLAPDAELFFATGLGGPANLAYNIKELKDAGCQVIVDDMNYPNESPFQDDVISQAVSSVTQTGVSYFSAAGDNGNLSAGTSSTWEGDCHPEWAVNIGSYNHNFAPEKGPIGIVNQILKNPDYLALFWSDPLGKSTNWYDLEVWDTFLGHVVVYSRIPQTGSQDPYQYIPVGNVGWDYHNLVVMIRKHGGIDGDTVADRFLHLSAPNGELQYATKGATRGHSTIEAAFSVGAVSAQGRTTPFTGAETLEPTTSDGPRRVFYYWNGDPIKPDISSTGGLVRKKPDITAADRVACTTPGFNPFIGTGAAAAHAAGIAALFISGNPTATPARIRLALTGTVLPQPKVWNEVRGYGIVMANSAEYNLSHLHLLLLTE